MEINLFLNIFQMNLLILKLGKLEGLGVVVFQKQICYIIILNSLLVIMLAGVGKLIILNQVWMAGGAILMSKNS